MTVEAYREQLRTYADHQRRERPTPPRETLSAEEEMMCRIGGGEILRWLNRGIGQILQERSVFNRMIAYDPQPTVVFLLDMPGLVAFDEILPEPPAMIIGLPADEFAAWPPAQSDPDMLVHIEIESRFELPSDGEKVQLAEEFSAENVELLRMHRCGIRWGSMAGSEESHVWISRNGTLELLEEGWARFII